MESLVILQDGRPSFSFKSCLFNAQRPTGLVSSSQKLTVEHDFKSTLLVRFDETLPFGNEPVFPTLIDLSKRVTETLDAFERLG